ncbi:ribonuclease H-like domain-containing protein [Tanacetum coccineum]
MWRLRIEQYFQVQDYALWDVMENGNSFKSVPQTTTNADGSSTSLIPGPVTTKEKVQKKNDVKARSMLPMALPNEHLMTFNQYKDAQTFAPSTESLDSIFNRLQKIVSQLAILGENISQEDLKLKFLRSLSSKWNSHVVVKGTSSSSLSSQNMAFMSSPSSTNEVNTAYEVSPASTQVSTASTQVSTTNLNDIEEMDLKWQFALLSMRTRSSRRTINVEEISSKAMLAIDGAGFDWSFMADEEVPTNMALMAFSDSELLIKEGYICRKKQLVIFKKNKVYFVSKLTVIKRDISYKDSEISVLKSELEKLKQEKESNQLKIEKFDNASKSLDKLIGSQIPDKSRKGLGFVSYNVVPPPPTGLFSPPTLDLSYSGLEEFQQPKFEGYGPKSSKSVSEDISNEVRESPDASLVEELVSNDKLEKKTVFPTVPKINFVRPQQQEKPVRKPVKLTAITIKGKGWPKAVNTARPNTAVVNAVRANQGHPQKEDQGYVDSGCSRHMTGNMSYLSDFKEFDGGYVTFGGGAKGGRITGKGTLKTGKLDFEDVYFVKELQFNLFSVSQMCDKKNSVLFTDTRCFVLSPDFKLADESQVLLKVPRKNNMYSVDMKNIVPKESLKCLVAKNDDESGIDDQEKPEDSSPDVNTPRPNINTASINTGSLNINTVSPTVPTALLESTYTEFFVDESFRRAQEVWTLVDLPYSKRVIGTEWVYKNKKDERGIVIRNKANMVAHGYTQEEGIDYDEVFAPVARIEEIRLFLAYASFKYFVVYQMDVKSAFLYGKIKEEVYVCQPLGFEDPEFPDKVYKVEKALYGLHQAPRAWYETLSTYLLDNGFQRAGFKDSPFDLEAYTDSDYAGASLDRKSTTCGCQFLGRRLISWQCKKQTIVANSSTEAEYVATAS